MWKALKRDRTMHKGVIDAWMLSYYVHVSFFSIELYILRCKVHAYKP